jgi:hypothetical protein
MESTASSSLVAPPPQCSDAGFLHPAFTMIGVENKRSRGPLEALGALDSNITTSESSMDKYHVMKVCVVPPPRQPQPTSLMQQGKE